MPGSSFLRLVVTVALLSSMLFALAARSSASEPVPLSANASCPGIRLQALQSYYGDGPSVVIRRDQEPDLLLGKVLAEFSTSCAKFWSLSNGLLSVFDAKDLSSTNPIQANSAIWLQDSETIVFSQGHRFELFTLSVSTSRVSPLFKPSDSKPCRTFSDGPDWTPPVLHDQNVVEWTYAVSAAEQGADHIGEPKPAKTVRIDARTGKVLSTEPARIDCDYYDPERSTRANKVRQ